MAKFTNFLAFLTTLVLLDVTSSTSDHIVVPSRNPKHVCAVGTIKCEIVKRSGSDESNARIPAGMKFSADQLGTSTKPVIEEAADSDLKSNVAVKNQISESLQVVSPIRDNELHPQLLNEPLKVNASEHKDSVRDEESELNISTPKPDVMTEKLTLSSHQAVIFPDHLQVPDNYKCQFIFGSLDSTSDDCKPVSVTESTERNEVVADDSLSNENVYTIAQEGENEDNVSEDVLPSDDNISSDASAQNHELPKAEITPPFPSTGFQNLPVLQTARDYSYGFMPPLMSPHFVQLDIPENGNSQVVSAASQPSVTLPAITGHSSIALSPPLFPYYRPYPNYIHYDPYYVQMYLAQHAHLLNHGVFPQQPPPPPPTANVYHLQAATAAVKSSTPSQNKQGSNEDIVTSEANVSNIPSTVQQGEDPQTWARAPVHDLPTLLPNYIYNFPQGSQIAAFSPLQAAALYHSSQTMTAQSTIQPPLMYQPQPSGAMVEHLVQPSAVYHHQHAPEVNRNDTAVMNTGTG